MATERKSFPQLAAPGGDTGLTRNRARMAAIPMIGLGAACMALLIGLLNRWLVPAVPVSGLGALLQIAVAGGAGLLAYGLVTYLTGLPETADALQRWRDRRLRRGD